MSPLQNNTKAFGLDISDLMLRATEFKGQGRNLVFAAYSQTALSAGLMKYGEIIEPRAVSEAIKKTVAAPAYGRFTTKRVYASLPEWKSYLKVIEIPQVDQQQLAETVLWEAGQHIPLTAEETYLDWRIIEANQARNTLKVLVGAIPKNIADSYTAVLEDADLKPVGLIVEPMAIAYALISPKLEKNMTALILDLGLHRMSSLIIDRGAVSYSSSTKDISGSDMTTMISQRLKLSEKEAEEAKRYCGLDPKQGHAAIPKILAQYLEKIVAHIRTVAEYYKTHNPLGSTIEQIILVGGGANLRNLDQELARALGLTVVIGDPWARCETLHKNKVIPAEQHLSYPTMLGLSLFGLSEGQKI